jgi:cytochrome P450
MLYPSRVDLPTHVPADRIVDCDVFAVDAPDGDFAGAMVRLRGAMPARLVWTQRNGGHWLALDGEQIRQILEQPELFSSRAMRVPKAANPVPPMMPLMVDPPDHTIYRRLIAPAMTPAEVRRLEHRARELSIQLIEGFAPRGRCEFVGEFAQQMPIAVFMGMLDLPASDRPLIMGVVDRIIRPDVPETRMRGFAELGDYMLGKIAERRAGPGDDLLSTLAQAEVNGVRLSVAELQGVTTVLMLAGLDTVAGMLTFIARFLADNPPHRADLRARPDITTRAIEEFLRRMAMANLTREVLADTELDGVTLRAGDLIVLPTALCNFPEGDDTDWLAVDFDRPRQQHATFGAGPHFCLGSMLARAEVRIFLEEWLARIPDFAIEPGAEIEVKVGAAAAIPFLPLVWTS